MAGLFQLVSLGDLIERIRLIVLQFIALAVVLALLATVSTPLLVGGNLADPFPISRSRLSSVFVSDTIGFWDDRILLTAGLRLQTIKAKSYSYATGALLSEYDEDKVTPVLGLVIDPCTWRAGWNDVPERFVHLQ